MTIPEFIQSIASDNPAYDVTHNFGKLMVLYRLMAGIPNISIASNHTTDKTSFDVTANNQVTAKSVNSYLNGISYTAYGTRYDIATDCEKRCIHISITRN